MKKNQLTSWPLIIIFIGLYNCLYTHFVSCQCPHYLKTWLLELKSAIRKTSHNLSGELSDWNQSTDCCNWSRVKCDNAVAGVISNLNLSNINMEGPIPKPLSQFRDLVSLDLSINQISGKVPGWLWKIGDSINFELDLSFNHLVGFEQPFVPATSHLYLSLRYNNFQGQFPVVGTDIVSLDCSNNNFTSIHPDLSFPGLAYFSLSRNKLSGGIPLALCNEDDNRGLQLVDLAFNHLNGTIPECLIKMTTELSVLNLRDNNLEGVIPDKFGMFNYGSDYNQGCGLRFINLNGIFLRGKFPPSLANCKDLQALDIGNNQINDTFPCHLKNLVNLQVLILRSNDFHGTMVCPESRSFWSMLQVLDIASNHFSGEVRARILFKWKAMMEATSALKSKPSHLGFDIFVRYYDYQVTSYYKNNFHELPYILTIFKSIDLSNNKFYRELPRDLGNLNALIVLNLSHNSFSGNIPSSVGNLTQIESLDLSCNAFEGHIPPQLNNLNSLGSFNLSYNNLSGKIPTSDHLLTFDASSYKGNPGLYGPPLTPINRSEPSPGITSNVSQISSNEQVEWMLTGGEVGIPVGLTIFLGPLLYIKRYREWYCKHLHKLVMKILRMEDTPRVRIKRGSRQQRR